MAVDLSGPVWGQMAVGVALTGLAVVVAAVGVGLACRWARRQHQQHQHQQQHQQQHQHQQQQQPQQQGVVAAALRALARQAGEDVTRRDIEMAALGAELAAGGEASGRLAEPAAPRRRQASGDAAGGVAAGA